MLEKNEIYRGLLKQPSILGLPMIAFVVFATFTAFVFMWVQSFYIIIPLGIIYLILFVAAKWDQNFFQVYWITANTIRRGKNNSIWGGNSYEP